PPHDDLPAEAPARVRHGTLLVDVSPGSIAQASRNTPGGPGAIAERPWVLGGRRDARGGPPDPGPASGLRGAVQQADKRAGDETGAAPPLGQTALCRLSARAPRRGPARPRRRAPPVCSPGLPDRTIRPGSVWEVRASLTIMAHSSPGPGADGKG